MFDLYTYDVEFENSYSSDNEGFEKSKEECMDYIKKYNGTGHSYFGEYRGGTVSVVCNETDETVYKEDIPDIDLDQIAQDEDLEVVWTTSGRNGYPENTHEALIGFDDFGQAERVAKRYGMEIMIFEQRDGWNLYYRTGRTAYGPIEVTSEDYGPDYQSFGPGVQQYYEDQVKPALSDCETFDELCELVEQQKKTCDAIKDLGENEMVLTYCGDYYDTVDRYAMSVHIDSKTTVIGVIRY